jgi:hypothetical protein
MYGIAYTLSIAIFIYSFLIIIKEYIPILPLKLKEKNES